MTSSIARQFMIGVAAAALLATAAPAAEVSPELIAKAKQEGQLTYYTDLIVDQIVRPLATAFEAKYGIKVALRPRRQPGEQHQAAQRVSRPAA